MARSTLEGWFEGLGLFFEVVGQFVVSLLSLVVILVRALFGKG